ncbi:SET domain [Macleaya cordata]|uniref:SET domain n=1 Tax=Macleaya cordata TaxID=56857 RepID=A0A200R3T3_MACCD|nr:SET domain [Macleaya cordata]
MDIQQPISMDSSEIPFSSGFMNVVDPEMVKDCPTSMVSGVSRNAEKIEGKSTGVTVTKSVAQRVQKIVSEEVFVERRVSPRLQNRSEKKRSYYYDSWKASCVTKKGKVSNKKTKIVERGNLVANLEEKEEVRRNEMCSGDVERSELVNVGLKEGEEKEIITGNSSTDVSGKSAYAKVKETLRAFNAHYLHFVQEEEKRCKKVEVKDPKTPKDSKSKKGKASGDDMKLPAKRPDLKAITKKGKARGTAKRPDLKAITKMMETKTILFPKKRFGHLPGVDVGHQFYSRAEMVVLGLHGHWLNGIDFMGPSYEKLDEYKGYTFPLATSIVLSGQYEDDQDNAEDVIYTGQGGNNLLGNRRQNGHQVMLRGNLALKNSIEQCVPVRVTRGHVSSSSYCGKVYTYDGLYKVVQYWAEKGVSGFTIFKFRLKRLEGQPPLTTSQVFCLINTNKFVDSTGKSNSLVSKDISGGQEDIPIPATNLVDDPPVAPIGKFDHLITFLILSIQVAESVKLPMSATGCNCRGTCMDPVICACARLNGSDFPYVRRDGGRLVKAKSVVFECGPNCGCGPGCINKTSQRGLKYRFEVFRTPKKGWAVRSWDFIPSGAPVCEYTGLLMRTDDIDNISENNYIFDIDCLQTMKGLDGRERRLEDVAIPSRAHLDETDDKKLESVPEFCIDAGRVGNIARFINHSCAPNLFVQCVLSSHHNIKLARVMLFAADNIPPMQIHFHFKQNANSSRWRRHYSFEQIS